MRNYPRRTIETRKNVSDALKTITAAVDGHKKFALQFSSGKDSTACLYLLRPWWDRLIVLWSNPGDPFPESIALMERVKGLVSEFHEVKGNSYGSAARAFPVDTLPIRATSIGRAVEPEGSNVTLQSRFDCCWQNFWAPLTKKVSDLGITILFRGQRNQESLRAPIKKGSRDPSGAEIILPIADWKESEVTQYLDSQGVELPEFYKFMRASPDCMHCTAYADDQRGRVAYLDKYHPQAAQEYRRRMTLISTELAHSVEEMRRNLDEMNNPTPNPLRIEK